MEGVPPEVLALVFEVQAAMPQLGKDERNPHHKYHYVSIDKYYDTVAKIARDKGLSWRVTETACEVTTDGDMKATYAFDLITKTQIVPWSNLTIIHPMQGAQTAGSALSYAEKLHMRSTFKVVTGEEDADATGSNEPYVPPKDFKPKPQERVTSIEDVIDRRNPENMPILLSEHPDEKGWSVVARVFTVFVPQCDNMQTLRNFYTDNDMARAGLKKYLPERWDEVETLFRDRKRLLTKQEKK